jgi:phosphoadenosine phosphosulfate reductase
MGHLQSTEKLGCVGFQSAGGNDFSHLTDLRSHAAELAFALAPLPIEQRLLHIRRAIRGRVVFTTSFGLEDQLILHVLRESEIDVEVVTLDTGRLFPETYDLWAKSECRYSVRIRAIYPQHVGLELLIAAQGINGFYNSIDARKACCHIRKVEPLNRALAGAAAWITGIRSGQSDARRDAGPVEVDPDRFTLKFNPLFDWTRQAVLNFIKARDVPVNSLHAKGFASIGCAPCTRAIGPNEAERAGRWWWEENGKKECGLHERPHERAAPDGKTPRPATHAYDRLPSASAQREGRPGI